MKTLQSISCKVKSRDCDAYVSFDSAENFYLTKFQSSFGISVVTAEGEIFFFTDGRYFEKAKRSVKQVNVVLWENWEKFVEKLRDLKLDRLLIDDKKVKVSTYNALKKSFSVKIESNFLSEFRAVKTEEEVALISRAVTVAETALNHVIHLLKPGITELEFRAELIKAFFKFGGEDEAFETIVASGKGSAIPHWKTSHKEIKDGEAVVVDFGVRVGGYVSDVTRTFLVGNVPSELKNIYDIVKEAQRIGIESLRAGVSCKKVDEAVREYISSKGYGELFVHSTGHGIGVEVHEAPTLSKRSLEILKKNMVVTVEPGIYVPELGGVRIEDDCLVTESGAFVLSTLPK